MTPNPKIVRWPYWRKYLDGGFSSTRRGICWKYIVVVTASAKRIETGIETVIETEIATVTDLAVRTETSGEEGFTQ